MVQAKPTLLLLVAVVIRLGPAVAPALLFPAAAVIAVLPATVVKVVAIQGSS
jgi:hypothetical protein